jgi:hypothetical protein
MASAVNGLIELPIHVKTIEKQHPLSLYQSSLITHELHDYMDVQIFTRILIGSDHQPFDMIFDTGSNWLWVFSRVCKNCH